MSEKSRPAGIVAIVIGLLAASRGASELLDVGRNVDVLMLFVGGVALGAGIVSLVNARKSG
jgi:uncharacterized membrane protein HdeD (DUF308 family)